MANRSANVFLTSLAALALPLCVVVALYVYLNGLDGTGGGFQAGALVAAILLIRAEVTESHHSLDELRVAAFGMCSYCAIEMSMTGRAKIAASELCILVVVASALIGLIKSVR